MEEPLLIVTHLLRLYRSVYKHIKCLSRNLISVRRVSRLYWMNVSRSIVNGQQVVPYSEAFSRSSAFSILTSKVPESETSRESYKAWSGDEACRGDEACGCNKMWDGNSKRTRAYATQKKVAVQGDKAGVFENLAESELMVGCHSAKIVTIAGPFTATYIVLS
jgi:hypothetical protein